MPTGVLAAQEEPDFTAFALTADSTLLRADTTLLTADRTNIGQWTGTVTAAVAPVVAGLARELAFADGGGGRSSRTVGGRPHDPVWQGLSRTEMQRLIAGLPEDTQKELLQNVDDEEVAFLLEHS